MIPAGFVVAAILMVALAVAHSILGERYILTRLFRRDQPKLFGSDSFTKQTLRFVWHALTIVWLGVAAILLLVPEAAQPIVAMVTIAVLGLTAILTVVISRGRHLSWLVELAIIAALATTL